MQECLGIMYEMSRSKIIFFRRWLNGKDTVAVPTHFFGIVTRCSATSSSGSCPASSLDVLGVLLPHQSDLPSTTVSLTHNIHVWCFKYMLAHLYIYTHHFCNL